MFYQDFAIMGTVAREKVVPLRPFSFEGVDLFIPADVEAVLEATYGSGWRAPDPHFGYKLPDQQRAFFARFKSNLTDNLDYWNSYYSGKNRRTPWVSRPSQFAALVSTELGDGSDLADAGCGNGRDSAFFASAGFTTRGFDYSREAVEYCTERLGFQFPGKLSFEALNFYNPLSVARSQCLNNGKYDIAYSRFFLHAVTPHGEQMYLDWARAVLKKGGCLAAEFRTSRDPRSSMGEIISENERCLLYTSPSPRD